MNEQEMNASASNQNKASTEKTHFLLKKMVDKQDYGSKLTKIIVVILSLLLAALVIIFAILIPRIFITVNKVEATMSSVDELLVEAKDSLGELTDLAQHADDLITANEGAVADAIKNFNKFDLEALNRTISSVGEMMEPVVNVLKFFRTMGQ